MLVLPPEVESKPEVLPEVSDAPEVVPEVVPEDPEESPPELLQPLLVSLLPFQVLPLVPELLQASWDWEPEVPSELEVPELNELPPSEESSEQPTGMVVRAANSKPATNQRQVQSRCIKTVFMNQSP